MDRFDRTNGSYLRVRGTIEDSAYIGNAAPSDLGLSSLQEVVVPLQNVFVQNSLVLLRR
jgi:hypothetical protein